MRPSEKLSTLVRFMRICAAICGVDVIDKNYKVNGFTYGLISFIAGFFVCFFYTIVVKITTDFAYVLEVCCNVGTAIQGVSKLVSILVYKSMYRSQYEFLVRIYVQYEAKGKDYSLVLDRCISRIRVVYQIAAALYSVCIVLVGSIPLYGWVLKERRVLTLQFLVPLLDVDTNFGYFCTIIVHSICILLAGAGNFLLDMFILMFFAHSTLFVDIFRLKVEELNEFAANDASQHLLVSAQLKDIIKWHQAYSNFVENSDMIFFWINFTQITTSAMSITLTLLTTFIGEWPGSYIYACYCISMLYMYCGMGTLVEIANNRLTEEIYAIHWYILTIKQQKATQLMLQKSQSPMLITVGGVAPLSVATALQVSKTVYSLFMVMLNFFR